MERKLTAILAADVVGYSRLMGEDEAGTHAALQTLRAEVIDTTIAGHRGRIVKLMGDGALVEFGSVVDALECAVAIQRGMSERGQDAPADKRIAFRIGINLGDIIVDGDDIYGNGVNVAARLETLAEPGGICLSSRVLEQVEKNVDVGYAFLGPQTVKNIDRPVNAYKVLLDQKDAGKTVGAPKSHAPRRMRWIALAALLALVVGAGGGALTWKHFSKSATNNASETDTASRLPEKRSLAVLPFTNIGGDPEQEYFADGMTDDLITDLSKVSDLLVIASHSVFTYKGKSVKVRDVARDLGVRYVLEGSVRRAGGRVRINAQLIDASTGGHLWAERYDREAAGVFEVQDAVTRDIVSALSVTLSPGEEADVFERETDSLAAYEAVLRGREHLSQMTRDGVAEAKIWFEKAIEFDPDYARAYVNLGFLHYNEWRLWGIDRDVNLDRALALGQKAAELDETLAGAYVLMALTHQYRGRHDAAEAEAQKALVLEPTHAETLGNLGGFLKRSGRGRQAVPVLEKAMRLEPFHPPHWLSWLGQAYFESGDHADAIRILEQAAEREPDYIATYVYLAASYGSAGYKEKAGEVGKEVLRLNPDFTVSAFKAYVSVSNRNACGVDRAVQALRLAGLPE